MPWEARGQMTPSEIAVMKTLIAWQREHEELRALVEFLHAQVNDLRWTVGILTELPD